MADRSQLESRIAAWIGEFDGLGAGRDKLPAFLAGRIVDTGLLPDDADVVTFRSMDGPRRLRVRGVYKKTDRLCLLHCAPVDGSDGMEILPVTDVLPDDAGRLATLLERLR